DGLGRPHLFHRPLTRRSFIGTVAAGAGVVLGSGLGLGAIPLPRVASTLAFAGGSADPRPLPGGSFTRRRARSFITSRPAPPMSRRRFRTSAGWSPTVE